MKKFLTIFVMLITFSMCMVQANTLDRVINPFDTVDITVDNANFVSVPADSMCYLTGVSADTVYEVKLVFNMDSLTIGAFSDSIVNADSSYIYCYADSAHITYLNGLDSIRISNDTVTGDTLTVTFPYVGNDTILYNLTITYYKSQPLAVENIETFTYNVYSNNCTVIVAGADGQRVSVYDMSGRMIITRTAVSDMTYININHPGVYVVRVGNAAYNVIVK